jgi:hypothetical protein
MYIPPLLQLQFNFASSNLDGLDIIDHVNCFLVLSILLLIPCQINTDFSNINFPTVNYFYGPVIINQYKLPFQARTQINRKCQAFK